MSNETPRPTPVHNQLPSIEGPILDPPPPDGPFTYRLYVAPPNMEYIKVYRSDSRWIYLSNAVYPEVICTRSSYPRHHLSLKDQIFFMDVWGAGSTFEEAEADFIERFKTIAAYEAITKAVQKPDV
jgi:hypothetical protein